MKKTFRLYYKCVTGYEPKNRSRNYLCMTLILLHSDELLTLAIDEDALEDMLRQCKNLEQKSKVTDEIFRLINSKIRAGYHDSSISIAV